MNWKKLSTNVYFIASYLLPLYLYNSSFQVILKTILKILILQIFWTLSPYHPKRSPNSRPLHRKELVPNLQTPIKVRILQRSRKLYQMPVHRSKIQRALMPSQCLLLKRKKMLLLLIFQLLLRQKTNILQTAIEIEIEMKFLVEVMPDHQMWLRIGVVPSLTVLHLITRLRSVTPIHHHQSHPYIQGIEGVPIL